MFASEAAELTFRRAGCANYRATWLRRDGAGPTTPQTLASGRDLRDQLRTAGIASTKRRM
jgi:hypothetical protein